MSIYDKYAKVKNLKFDETYLKYAPKEDVNEMIAKAKLIEESNGFTENRTMRQIGQIPMEVYTKIVREDPTFFDDKERVRKFLLNNPAFMTVKAIKSNKGR